MPQQDAYLQGLGERLPFDTREKLLFSNKDLPPLLRILIPKVESMAQYRQLQNDENWLHQKVYVNKQCYKDLSKRIMFLAKQSIRLDEVQTDF